MASINIYGDCRTKCTGSTVPTMFAKLFEVTLRITVGTNKIYSNENKFLFRLIAGNIVKEYSFFSSNNGKYTVTDLTENIDGIYCLTGIINGVLSFYAKPGTANTSIIMQVIQTSGYGFIKFINFSDFIYTKSKIPGVASISSVNTYNTVITYADGWSDYSTTSKSVINVNNNVVDINIKAKCSNTLVTTATEVLSIDSSNVPNSVIRVPVLVWYLDTDNKTVINEIQGFAELGTDGKANIYGVTKAKEIFIHFCYLK